MSKERNNGERINQHFHCIANEFDNKEPCNSSDALSVYADEIEGVTSYNAYCFSCGQGFSEKQVSESSLAHELGIENGVVTDKKTFNFVKKADPLTKEEIIHLKDSVGFSDKPYRSLHPDWLKFFGHMVKRNSNGVATQVYYPETENDKVCGFKIRILPKAFTKVGRTGKSSQLSGQFRYKAGGKRILYTSGENDKVAAWGALQKYDVHVVSPTTGEGSAASQAAEQYEFFDRYDEIYVGMDNDDAGEQATRNICKVLPANKIKIVKWSDKDCHKLLEDDKAYQIIRDFFNAKDFVDSGIKSAADAMSEVEEFLNAEKVTLPPYLHRLQENMRGGIRSTGAIINIIGDTSIGKCHGKGTNIMMSDMSTKLVEDIVVGDLVMGADGNPRKVLSLARGRDIMYRIEQKRGEDYIVNSEHILSLRAGYNCKNSGVFKGDIVNLTVKDYISRGNKLKRSLKGYKGELVNLGVDRPSLKHPWLLGLWLADGCSLYPKISIADEDSEILEQVKQECIDHGYQIGYTCAKPNVKDYYIKGGFKDFLRSYDLIGNKHIPQDYLMGNLHDRYEIMAGLLDGDGYLVSNGFEIAQKSDVIAEGVVKLSKSLSLDTTTRKVVKGCQNNFEGEYNRLFVYGKTDKIPNRLSRKKVQNKSKLRENINTSINVVEIGEDDYYGFNLDGDRLYCLVDGTVTHNSLFSDNLEMHWFFNSPLIPTVISLERTAGELMSDMYSLYLKKNLTWFKDGQDAINYLHRPDVKELCEKLVYDDEGHSRFYLIDERDGSIETLKRQVDRSIKQYGSKLFIFDPLTDFLRSLGTEAQEDFMMYQKMMKKEGVVFVNVLHTRKPPQSKDGEFRKVTEYEILGSGSFVQSADMNIVLNRNKMAEDPIERNTTIVDMPKCRGGVTGEACKLYYDQETRQQYDFDDHFSGGRKINPDYISNPDENSVEGNPLHNNIDDDYDNPEDVVTTNF